MTTETARELLAKRLEADGKPNDAATVRRGRHLTEWERMTVELLSEALSRTDGLEWDENGRTLLFKSVIRQTKDGPITVRMGIGMTWRDCSGRFGWQLGYNGGVSSFAISGDGETMAAARSALWQAACEWLGITVQPVEVTANDHTMGGSLVFAGTRMLVSVVWNRIRDGETDAEIKSAYPELTDEQIAAARAAFERSRPVTISPEDAAPGQTT